MATFAAKAHALASDRKSAGRRHAARVQCGQERAGMKIGRVPSVAMALSILVGSVWVCLHGADTPADQRDRVASVPATALATANGNAAARATTHGQSATVATRNPFAATATPVGHPHSAHARSRAGAAVARSDASD